MPRGGFCFGEGEGQFGCGKSMPLSRCGEAEPGFPHVAFRTLCPQTGQSVRSEAHYAAAVLRLVRPASGGEPGKTGERAALPHWAEAEPGPPHVVRIRTDIFLRRGKCPRCRVRWGETGRSTFRQTNLLLARAALGYGQLCAGWPRHCPPPHAAFRTRCTVQRVRSEAHYAAAVPRLVQLSSGGEPCKTGERAALPHWAEAEPDPPAPGPAARGHHP